MLVSDLGLVLARAEPWKVGANVVSAGVWIVTVGLLVARHRQGQRVPGWQWWTVIVLNVPIDGVFLPVGPVLWLTGRAIDRTETRGPGRILDRWVSSPIGVSEHTAERLRRSLEPGEQLRFVFEVQTKRTAGRQVLHGFNMVTGKGRLDVFATRYVVITDRSVLLMDRDVQFLFGRLIRADLGLPSTFGPVKGDRWIMLNGESMYVPGGRQVVDKADAALIMPRSP